MSEVTISRFIGNCSKHQQDSVEGEYNKQVEILHLFTQLFRDCSQKKYIRTVTLQTGCSYGPLGYRPCYMPFDLHLYLLPNNGEFIYREAGRNIDMVISPEEQEPSSDLIPPFSYEIYYKISPQKKRLVFKVDCDSIYDPFGKEIVKDIELLEVNKLARKIIKSAYKGFSETGR
jgi:hypothetical protein